jgi:hypothetical protein
MDRRLGGPQSQPQAYKILKKLGNSVEENLNNILHEHGLCAFRIVGLR